jgi:CheY-like chemotaxis protein
MVLASVNPQVLARCDFPPSAQGVAFSYPVIGSISPGEVRLQMSDAVNLPAPDGDPAAAGKPHEGASNPMAGASNGEGQRTERRNRRRALISAPVRVRSMDFEEGIAGEISTTLDVSRGGFLFVSSLPALTTGMQVQVTFPYSKSPNAVQAEQPGRVVRVTQMPDGRRAVAIALGEVAKGELVDTGGRFIQEKSRIGPNPETISPPKISDCPVVLVVDADAAVRDTLKMYLNDEGYEPIAVPNAAEAHAVLSLYTPALVVAEIEGDDLPGYDLCARIKTTPRLQTIPVVLMTRSAYPSDYANAHSLGAVVCMAKPFRMERFGHVVKLLAPKLHDDPQPEPAPRPAHSRRKSAAESGSKHRSSGKGHKGHGPRNRR